MPVREWREAIDMRSSSVGLGLVLLVAGLLRFWALGSGIPHSVHPDEPEIVARAVGMMKTGDYNPHFFEHPSLLLYVQLGLASVRFVAGAMTGAWTSLDEVGAADFYFAGRVLIATLGTVTVLLVYFIGMRWGARHALLAAGLLAVTAAHVRESHFVLPDVPMTFLVTLTLLLALRAHERGSAAGFVSAGVAAGLAAATKYPGVLALLFPLLGAWMTLDAKPSRLIGALGAVGAATVAFLIGSPYTVLDLPAFLNGVGDLAGRYGARTGQDPGAGVYLEYLRQGLGWPALILTVSGFVLGVVRAVNGPGKARWVLVVAFAVGYGSFLANRTLVDARHLLPLLPLACILAAIAVVSGVSLLRRFEIPRAPRTALIASLTILAVLPPAIEAVRLDRQLGRTTTQAAAYEWIVANVPRGARLMIEAGVLHVPAELYEPVPVERVTKHALVGRRPPADFIVGSSGLESDVEDPASTMGLPAARLAEVARFRPSPTLPGPPLSIYRVID